MSTSLIKYKDLALKVIYYTKTRQLGTKIFFATSKFQDVLQYFERNLKDSQTYLKSCYFLNGKQIYPSDTLLYFCTVDPSLRLVEEDMFLEIEELEHLDDASDPIFEKLLKPLINPFRLIILNIKEGILQMVDFPKEKLAELGLDTLNDNFACCNSTDSLYLSCGKYLWIISHNNFQIEKKEMPFSKEKHSMAYIISNNTVFFVGGTQESFYYDINSKEFISWGKMNGISEKPALLQFGDFLYCFNSFNQQGIYFEKTKLTNPAKKWEKLVPQSGDQESGFFYNQLFGVSKCSGGNVLFAGGLNNQLRTFVYNLKANVLFITPSKDESILLNERNFYKIDHNFSIAIPTNLEKDHIIAIINKNSKTLNLITFEQIGVQTRNNLLQIDNPRNRLPGNLVIQCRYMALKDYENFLKSKEQQEANKTKGGFNIYNRKEQEKKLGDKLSGNNPYKYQYRGKTPLALERISEGRIEEEDDDDMKKEPKSSSAKKEKRSFDLGMKLENIGKFNFATQKREDKKVDSKNNGKNNKNNPNNNKVNQTEKENKENINLNNNNENAKNNEEVELNKKEKNNFNLNSEEMVNKRNTYVEVKQPSLENFEKNKENNIIKDGKNKEDKKEEIQNKIYSSETEVKRGNKKKVKQSREVRHKKINLNLDKKEEGKANELNSSNLSSTPPSTLTDNTPISRNTNTQSENQNSKINNQSDINKIKRDLNNFEANKGIEKVNNINININNNYKKIENEENRKSNSNTPNSTKSKEKSIKKSNNNQNRIISSSVNSNNMNYNMNNNMNKNMNNYIDNNIGSYNMVNNEQKKVGNMSKNNNNIQNLKNYHQNIKDNNTNVILKSNTVFTQKNQNMNNSLSSNPFIDNSKYQNIVEKETYQYREEKEPNANKILANKNTKSIKGIKKIAAQKKGYHTNTVTSMPLVNSQQMLSESNNNENSQSNNFKMISYKTSTHKQIKGKRIAPLDQNSNNILMNINDNENMNFSEIPKNLKNQHKKDLTPVQKNRNIAGNKVSAFYTEGNVKSINYSEQFIKFSNHKIQQDFSGQRQNTSSNISVSNSIYSNTNANNNSLRMMKSDNSLSNQRNISNEKLFKGNNTMRNNEVVISKDGKKYVMGKNPQRVKREDEDGKIDERKKILYSIDD